jgi:thiol-disulfide isomerase/thioredoxin
VVIISRGAVDANRDKFAAHGLDPILLEQNFEISTSYRAYGTPSAVVVSAERTIGSPVAAGADAIRALVGRTLGQILRPRSGQGHLERANDHRHPPAGVPLGDQAPHVSVTSLDGRRVRIEAARERPTVVLFWNPTCGFCQAMRSDILAWETAAPQGGPALIVVSSGSVEQCRNERFRGSVLIDSDFIAGRSFGASGTPSAVLLDQDGRVASRVVVGREAVLALLQPPTSTSYSASAGVTRGVGTESAMNR